MNRKNIEAYLLSEYDPQKSNALGQQLLDKAMKSAAITAMSFVLLLCIALFYSWHSLILLSFRENINTNLIVFISASVPICALVALLWAKIRIYKRIGGSGAAIAGAVSPLVFAGAMWFAVLRQNTESEPLGIFHILLLLTFIGLLGAPTMIYRVYLLRKYCPYLANYCGGEIDRPDEPDV